MDGYFLKMAVQGQSFFAADGDTGAAIGAIDPPDDDPYITIVGGTTLATAGPRGAWLSETVWNAQEGPGVAVTGGGISTIYNIPVWQKGLNLLANHGSNTKRNTPDVAMVADNIFIVADNGFQELSGGTSAAAPLWAAFAALANQQAVGAGLGPIGFVNPALYNIGTNSSFTACFDDVTVGNNTNNNASQFFAVPGYDLCTGWGSPSGSSLIIALTQPDGFEIQPGRGLVANGPVGGPFTASTQTLSLTNAGKSVFSWSAGSTSTWLHVSNSTSTLTAGGGAATVTLTLNPSANLLPAGVYTANVWFTNLTSGLVQIRQFTLQVNLEMVQDGSYEAGDFCYWNLAGDPSVYSYNFVDDGTYSSYSPVSGNYFAALGQPATLAYLSQPLVTRAGQLYLLSLWLENPSGATPNQFQIQWNTNVTAANVVFNQTNMGTFGYTNLLFVLQAATNTTTLQFGFRNDNDYFALDNVSVVPVPAPMFQTPVPIPGAIELTWAALPGLQYQLQYKPNLTQTNWIDLGIPITASNNSVSTTDLLSSDQQRFYRVQLVP
jgi:subtilase family serine protease